METRVSDRFERIKTAIVTVLCLGGAIAGSVALYLDRTASGRAGEGPPLAMVQKRESSVRRKPAGSYLWTNAMLAEDLYRRDAIQTNADSSAVIRFADNTVLEVGENSLVVIDDVKNLEFGAMRGSLVLRGADGSDKKIQVDAEGKATIQNIPIKLLQPEHLTRAVTTTPKREIEFGWFSPAKDAKYRLEVSSDRTFPPGRTQKVEAQGQHSAKLSLTSGRYFWRVVQDKATTEVRQFRIAEVSPLIPTYPGARDKISRWGGDETQQFRWLANADADVAGKHFLELADDAAFERNKRESQISAEAGASLLENVKPGRHFWRLRSQYGDVAVRSKVESIDISEAGELGVTPAFPEEGARIELSRTGLRFGWDSETPQVSGPKAPKIEFELELQGADGKSVVTSKGQERAYLWNQPKAGRYKWRVSALAGDKRVGQTQWRTLFVQDGKPAVLLEPADKKDFRYWVEATPFEFKWSPDSLGAREKLEYQLEVSKDREFKEPVAIARTKDSFLPSDKAKLEAGTWFWRVTLLDPQGAHLRSSEPRQLSAGQYPVLAAPSVSSTKAPPSFNPLEDETSPVLTWEPVAEAQGYEVSLLQPGRAPAAGGPTVLKKNVVGTRFELPGKELKAGEYEWRVRAIDRARRLGEPSAPVKLGVTYGAPLGAPEVTTQEVQ